MPLLPPSYGPPFERTDDPNNWWDEIGLGRHEVLIFGVGDEAPGVGGPNNITSICYLDGSMLNVGTGLFSHSRMDEEPSFDEQWGFGAMPLNFNKDYCLAHFRADLGVEAK